MDNADNRFSNKLTVGKILDTLHNVERDLATNLTGIHVFSDKVCVTSYRVISEFVPVPIQIKQLPYDSRFDTRDTSNDAKLHKKCEKGKTPITNVPDLHKYLDTLREIGCNRFEIQYCTLHAGWHVYGS